MNLIRKNLLRLALIGGVSLWACGGALDVVATDSQRAFQDLVNKIPNAISRDADRGWTLNAPDGAAQFHLSDNFARTTRDLALTFDARPFIAAGLDKNKLPPSIQISGDDREIIIGVDLSNAAPTAAPAKITDSFADFVKNFRTLVGYHGALDHYGITIGDGNLLEWAKNLTTNDKDLVFVLNPAPFIAAGVDVNQIDGWVFGKVTVDDANGKPIQVDKILKPFNFN